MLQKLIAPELTVTDPGCILPQKRAAVYPEEKSKPGHVINLFQVGSCQHPE